MLKIALAAAALAATTLTAALPASAQDAAPVATPSAQEKALEANMRPYLPKDSDDLLALLKNCDTDACMSYVSGVIGGISVYAVLTDNQVPFCAPTNVTPGDVRDAIISTIETTNGIGAEHPSLAVLATFGRHWPCVSDQAADALASIASTAVPETAMDALGTSGNHALVLGDAAADAMHTLTVFYDANCPHCRRFREEVDILAANGWKIVIFPVATTAEESAGYAAVQIALRDTYPDVAEMIYRHAEEGTLDIADATAIAMENGVSQTELFTLLAKSNGISAVAENTQAFFELGAKGTPSWIVGLSLYSGFVTADAISALADTFEGDEEELEVVEPAAQEPVPATESQE